MTTNPPEIKVGVQIRVDHAIKSGGDVTLAKAFGNRLQRSGLAVEYISSAEQALRLKPQLLIAFNLDQPLELFELCAAAKRCGATVAVYTLHHPTKGLQAYLRSSLPGIRGRNANLVDADPEQYHFATA
jgi:hypothetical protein